MFWCHKGGAQVGFGVVQKLANDAACILLLPLVLLLLLKFLLLVPRSLAGTKRATQALTFCEAAAAP